MEYVVGPVLALLVAMKFTAYKTNQQAEATVRLEEKVEKVESKIVDNNKMISQQTLKMMTPVAKSIRTINQQLGL